MLGVTVSKIEIAEGEEYLRFHTDAGIFTWQTEGECCSETWFAEIHGPETILGAPIVRAEVIKVESVEEDGRTRQDEDKFYGFELKTSKGICRVIYRNSSNGYYYGDAFLLSADTCNSRAAKFKPITKDWTAWGNG